MVEHNAEAPVSNEQDDPMTRILWIAAKVMGAIAGVTVLGLIGLGIGFTFKNDSVDTSHPSYLEGHDAGRYLVASMVGLAAPDEGVRVCKEQVDFAAQWAPAYDDHDLALRGCYDFIYDWNGVPLEDRTYDPKSPCRNDYCRLFEYQNDEQ